MSATSSFLNKNSKQLAIISAIVGLMMLIGTGIYTFKQTKSDSESQSATPIVTETAKITSVSALGRIEPQDEVIKVSASPSMAGAKVKTLLVMSNYIVVILSIQVPSEHKQLFKCVFL
jgi:HlyD family secretion protein